MKVNQSPENEAFYAFQRDMMAAYLSLQSKQKPEQIRTEMATLQKKWIKDHSSLFVSKLINASLEPEIPVYTKLVKTSKDSIDLYKFQFTYYK